jgi:internalin A
MATSKKKTPKIDKAILAIQDAAQSGEDTLALRDLNLTELPQQLFSLRGLKSLDLRGNSLTDLPRSFAELSTLAALTIWGNPLGRLPEVVFELATLEYLHAGDVRMGSLSPEIARLKKLRHLYIWENGLKALPNELSTLNLEHIFLGRNEFETLPDWLCDCRNLREVSAFENQFRTVPDVLFRLPELKHLDLARNHIDTIPPQIGQLKALETLNFSANRLSSIASEIGSLPALRYVDVSGNQLMAVPEEIGSLPQLRVLHLSRNPALRYPPKDVVDLRTADELDYWQARTSISADDESPPVRYLRACATGNELVWESKLLLVGEGQVGKTWLYEALNGRLGGGTHPPDTGTIGVEIGDLRVSTGVAGQAMRLNCWDFAGQSINHATHQFFFSDRALFVLVWSARGGWEAGRLRRWLTNIRDRAPGARILLVATQIDQPHSDYPEKDLRVEFPQIVETFEVSSSTGIGIDALRTAIARHAETLPLMGLRWPSSWRAALEQVRTLRAAGPYRPVEEIQHVLLNAGVAPEDDHVLLRWLSDLGEILFFAESVELGDIVVLDPQWVTKRVGEVLASNEVKTSEGILTRDCLLRLWGDLPEYVRKHLLALMEHFDLAYRIPDDAEHRSLVVERLPENAPSYEPLWQRFQGQPELRLRFKLGAMHPGIPTWFIARCHRFTQHLHWVRGVLFGDDRSNPRHLALVVANEPERRVDFTIRGPFPWGFMPLLVDGFMDTITARYPGLEVTRWVPCPGTRRDKKPCDNEVALEDLINLRFPEDKSEGPIETWQCTRCRGSHQIEQMLIGLTRLPLQQATTIGDVLKAIGQSTGDVISAITESLAEQRRWIQLELVREWNSAQQAEENSCPSVFTLFPVGDATVFHTEEMELQLYCMNPDCWHPAGAEATCRFRPTRRALRKAVTILRASAKWLRPAANLLPAGAVVAGDTVTAMGDWAEGAKNAMDLTLKVTEELEKLPEAIDTSGQFVSGGGSGRQVHNWEADLQSLKSFLDDLPFPTKPYGGLRRVRTPEGHVLWLCPAHRASYGLQD